MPKIIHAVFWLSLTFVLPAFADTVVANNAGSLPGSAQDLSGDLALTEVTGALDFPYGVSMFAIYIADPVDFSAQTVTTTLGVPDTELFLFDSSGFGVYENDDASGANTLSCLPSAGAGNPCSSSRNGLGPLSPGIYYLAITRSDNLPESSSGYIFSFGTFSTDVLGPDITMGGGDPINGWDGDVFTGTDSELVNYDIIITDSPAVATPEPAAWPFVTAAVAALFVFRQKLQARHAKTLLLLSCLGTTLVQFSAFAQNSSHVAPPNHLVQAALKLQDPSLVEMVGANAKQNGIPMTAAQQRAYLAQLSQKQDAVLSLVRSIGGEELGRVSIGHNALMVSIDLSQLPSLRAISGVAAVRPLTDYKLSLSDGTTDFIGATLVQNTGITGQGIRIAMLDSGIDYTHYNLGGSGQVSDYLAAKAAASGTPPVNLFPTTKVVGGYDFVGDVWPNGPLAPDANPIDLNGHGTLTADIAGGHSLDGLHAGTAPGSELYAVKVCSSVSSECSSVAILKGIDFALDPNHTGTVNHPVDIISMSAGSAFGQLQDDASEALAAAVTFGVLSVVAAGDNGDIPYAVAAPAAQPEVLAVGAANGVSAFTIPLLVNSPISISGSYSNTATLSFAPITSTTTANVVYAGRGCPAGAISTDSPADPYLTNPSGAIALIDRGSCSVSLKIDAAARAGAVGVLIGLVAPGDAVSFVSGGGSDFVPSLVVTQSTSNVLKNALLSSAVNATLSRNNALSLASDIASYSSRGPDYSFNMLKPDLNAPGTIEAAQAGTGNGQTTGSGTSLACPLVAGSAALLLSENHTLAPLDLKALLMETAEVNTYENSATEPGVLAPLSRAGAGQVRPNRAVAASTAVWDASDPIAVSLSFGTYRLNTNQTYRKKVVVRNYSNAARTYSIGNSYRDAPNQTGVTITVPPSIAVPANSAVSFNLTLTVNVASLPVWTLNGGTNGGNGELLNTVEYAGYLSFASGSESVHVPWHILPHNAANVQPATTSLTLNGTPKTLALSNTPAAVAGQVDAFSLTGTGVQFPPSSLPGPGSDAAVTNLAAVGVRSVCLTSANPCTSPGAQFAITTFSQRSHPDVPAEFDVHIDINQDGVDDLVVFNADIGFATTGTYSGQNGVFVNDLTSNTTFGPFFYTIADLDSANAIFTVPLSALATSTGLELGVSTPFTFSVKALDNYFTHSVTDSIGPMKYELDMPQVSTSSTVTVAPGAFTNLLVSGNGAYNGKSPSQTGLLLMYTDGKAGQESSTIKVVP